MRTAIVQAVLPEIEKKQIMCTPFPMIKDKEKAYYITQ